MTQPTLSTARLRLLPLADEHLNFEVELDSDPEVMRYIDGRARSADLGLNRIFAQTMAVNAASRATMSAVGLTFVRAFISGEPYADLPEAEQGEVEYEITRTTWLGGHAAAGATHPSGETG
jgi:hypothetical protein